MFAIGKKQVVLTCLSKFDYLTTVNLLMLPRFDEIYNNVSDNEDVKNNNNK